MDVTDWLDPAHRAALRAHAAQVELEQAVMIIHPRILMAAADRITALEEELAGIKHLLFEMAMHVGPSVFLAHPQLWAIVKARAAQIQEKVDAALAAPMPVLVLNEEGEWSPTPPRQGEP